LHKIAKVNLHLGGVDARRFVVDADDAVVGEGCAEAMPGLPFGQRRFRDEMNTVSTALGTMDGLLPLLPPLAATEEMIELGRVQIIADVLRIVAVVGVRRVRSARGRGTEDFVQSSGDPFHGRREDGFKAIGLVDILIKITSLLNLNFYHNRSI
jgi:hypothetical protein